MEVRITTFAKGKDAAPFPRRCCHFISAWDESLETNETINETAGVLEATVWPS